MRPKSLILLALALGCGLIAAVGINQILATPSNEAQTVSIVVAKAEIRKGDLIKPEDLRLQEWHVDALPEGAITKIDDLAERRVKTLVVPGEAILESKLVPKGANKENEIPAGMKAVTVSVDNETSMHGLILPGDNVDVLLHVTANASAGIPQTTTKILLKNIKVHATDDVTERPAPGEPTRTVRTVTLLVTPKESLIVTHAMEIGKIKLVGRSSKDDDAEEAATQSVSNGSVLDGVATGGSDSNPSLPALPGLTPLPKPDDKPGMGDAIGGGLAKMLEEMRNAREFGTPTPVEQPWKMILIEGITSKEMEFSKDARTGQVVSSSGGPAAGGAAPGPALDFLPLPPIDQEEGPGGIKTETSID